MNIRLRLTIGFGVTILAMVCITTFALMQMGNIKERVNSIVDVSSRKVILAQKLKTNILTVTVLEKNILLVGTETEAQQLIQKVERESSHVTEKISALRQLMGDELLSSLDSLSQHWADYLETAYRANQLAVRDSYKQASQLSHGAALIAFDKLIDELANLQESNIDARALLKEDAQLLDKLKLESTLIQGIENSLFDIQEIEQKLLFARSQENIDNFVSEIQSFELSIAEHLTQLKANPVPIDRDAYARLNLAKQNYFKHSHEIQALISFNPKMQANTLLSVEGEKSLKEVDRLLSDIISRNEYAMSKDQKQSNKSHESTQSLVLTVLILTGIICSLMSYFLSQSITLPMSKLNRTTRALAEGDTSVRAKVDTNNEVGDLAKAFNHMAEIIHQRVELQTGLNALTTAMRGDQPPEHLAQNILNCLAELFNIPVAALYFFEEEKLSLITSYAFVANTDQQKVIQLGQGIVGQAALEKKPLVLTGVSSDNALFNIESGIGTHTVEQVLAHPLVQNTHLIGILVFGSNTRISQQMQDFLVQASENIAIGLAAAKTRAMQNELLDATQEQATQLHQQQESLSKINQTLEQQTEALNDQKSELEDSKKLLEYKAEELQKASQYKSDFLANMSHELRSPLNSMLLLSKTLIKNEDKNLHQEQIDSLKYIYSGGQELLSHINDILDLSKVEAGKLDFYIEEVDTFSLCQELQRAYRPQVDDKGIGFELAIDDTCPRFIQSDKKRITQILRNLISNAIKFTTQGKITLSLYKATESTAIRNKKLSHQQPICFAVKDTGIGIPAEKCEAIFEAFQQADGSTSRKYGGTGLGLTISREFSKRLHGEIHVHSEKDQGSEFILVLPGNTHQQQAQTTHTSGELAERKPQTHERRIRTSTQLIPDPVQRPIELTDDRASISPDDITLLIIEDDIGFAKILKHYSKNKGFKTLVSNDGVNGLALAKQFRPSAIILDLGLPGMSGKEVLSALETDTFTHGIPIHIISSYDESSGLSEQIHDYLTKPVSNEELESLFALIEQETQTGQIQTRNTTSIRSIDAGEPLTATDTVSLEGKQILVVDDDIRNMFALSQILKAEGVNVLKADNGELAVARVTEHLENDKTIDAILMDIMMPVMDGYEATRQIRSLNGKCNMPIIALTAKAMAGDREKCLEAGADDYLTKPLDEAKLLALLRQRLSA